MQDWCSRGSCFDSGSMQFFCAFMFMFLFFFFLFVCCFFFGKKTERKGKHMLLDSMSSLKMLGL